MRASRSSSSPPPPSGFADVGSPNGSIDRTAQTTAYARDGTPCPGGAAGLANYP